MSNRPVCIVRLRRRLRREIQHDRLRECAAGAIEMSLDWLARLGVLDLEDLRPALSSPHQCTRWVAIRAGGRVGTMGCSPQP